jgi:hypothetical protein
MALALRSLLRRPPHRLLSEQGIELAPVAQGRTLGPLTLGGLCVLIGLIAAAASTGGSAASEALGFMLGGTLLLVGGVVGCSAWLRRLAGSSEPSVGKLWAFGRRGAARRPARSLTSVGLLACGVFLVIAVGAHHRSPPSNPSDPKAPTGGFQLWVETALPILPDITSTDGREKLGIDDQVWQRINPTVVPMRVRDGDDASCLNLNQPQRPRLLGVPVDRMTDPGRFRINPSADESNPWPRLRRTQDPDWPSEAVPGFVDASSARWILKRSLGEAIDYTDSSGEPMPVRIAGLIEDSVLQGSVLIAESAFIDRFPDVPGHRAMLIACPADEQDALIAELRYALADHGLFIEPTAERLARFNRVQNTYTAIFAALGGLGVILGSVGLGVLTARAVLERSGELALLRAVGFDLGQIRGMVAAEHRMLLGMGLLVGLISAGLAVWPSLQRRSEEVPWGLLGLVVLGIAAVGGLAVTLAVTLALRGPIVRALAREVR